MTSKVRKTPRKYKPTILELYRCNAPDCDQPTDAGEAVWWTPHGSTCSEVCAWALVNSKKEAVST